MMPSSYVHGYSGREAVRLSDQAETLTSLLHADTIYPEGSKILEAGCGTGAQTIIISKKNIHSHITSIDISSDSLNIGRQKVRDEGIRNVTHTRADISALPFNDGYFDHIFVCFVLEHLTNPRESLQHLKRVLKPGGSITVIEGDHGSVYFYPESRFARMAIDCLIRLQSDVGGNSLIGRELYPLLSDAGYTQVQVSPRMVYVDASKPSLVEGFTKKTFISMVEGVEADAIGSGLIDPGTWARGLADLYRTTEKDGTFCYSFFKATGIKR